MNYKTKFLFSDSHKTPSRVCCFPDSVVSSCYKWCEENTCENVLNPPQNCTTECEYNICVCREGLYRNECNECVKKEECYTPCKRDQPIRCPGENEQLNGCFYPSDLRECPSRRCSTRREIFFNLLLKLKRPGLCAWNVCDCRDGYLRNRCGKCVPAADCSKKCSVGVNDSCSQPNETRVKRFRKSTARTCKNYNDCSKRSRKTRKGEKYRKNVCDCGEGFLRNKCGRCSTDCNVRGPCMCTNPCLQSAFEDVEWICINECNGRDCVNYHELKTKLCPAECVYACQCSKNKNLWFNGTHCVPAEKCPPLEELSFLKKVLNQTSLTNLAQETVGWANGVYEAIGSSYRVKRKVYQIDEGNDDDDC